MANNKDIVCEKNRVLEIHFSRNGCYFLVETEKENKRRTTNKKEDKTIKESSKEYETKMIKFSDLKYKSIMMSRFMICLCSNLQLKDWQIFVEEFLSCFSLKEDIALSFDKAKKLFLSCDFIVSGGLVKKNSVVERKNFTEVFDGEDVTSAMEKLVFTTQDIYYCFEGFKEKIRVDSCLIGFSHLLFEMIFECFSKESISTINILKLIELCFGRESIPNDFFIIKDRVEIFKESEEQMKFEEKEKQL